MRLFRITSQITSIVSKIQFESTATDLNAIGVDVKGARCKNSSGNTFEGRAKIFNTRARCAEMDYPIRNTTFDKILENSNALFSVTHWHFLKKISSPRRFLFQKLQNGRIISCQGLLSGLHTPTFCYYSYHTWVRHPFANFEAKYYSEITPPFHQTLKNFNFIRLFCCSRLRKNNNWYVRNEYENNKNHL